MISQRETSHSISDVELFPGTKARFWSKDRIRNHYDEEKKQGKRFGVVVLYYALLLNNVLSQHDMFFRKKEASESLEGGK